MPISQEITFYSGKFLWYNRIRFMSKAIKVEKFQFVFHWYFTVRENFQWFENFKKRRIYNGHSVSNSLLDLVKDFIDNDSDGLGDIDFVTENELITELHEKGYKTSKRSLLIYRQKDILKDDEGSWWGTDGTNIVYVRPKMLDFIESRAMNPTARLLGAEEHEGAALQT